VQSFFTGKDSVGSNPSLNTNNTQNQEPAKWPQRLALVMAIFAFVFFGGGYYLNQRFLQEEAKSFGTRSPVNGQKIWSSGQELFRFEWTGITGEDDLLEVARDPEFRDLVMETPSPRSPLSTDKIPGEGDYYYRIVRRSDGQAIEILQPVRFTLIMKSAPQLIYPFGNMSSQEGKAMRFYWQAKHGVTKYRFQVAFDKSFEHLLSDFVVEETQTTPQNIPVGEFYWRVRGEGDSKNFTQWTEPRRLTIERPATLASSTTTPIPPPPEPAKTVAAFAPAPPVIARAEKPAKPDPKAMPIPSIDKSNQKLVLRFKPGTTGRSPASESKSLINPPSLVWDKIKGAKTYEVQVSSRADFAKIEWSRNLSKNQAYWDSARPGRYYWRVRANGNGAAKSEYSNTAILEMSLPSPSLKKSITHLVKAKTRAEYSMPTSIPLTWNKVPGASGYKILVADNQNFLPSKVDLKVDRNSANVPLTEGGNYYVKVAVLGSDGEQVSEFSKVSTLKLDKRAPAAATPILAIEKKPKPTPEVRVVEAPPAPKNDMPAPQPKLPPNGVSLVSLNGTQDPIVFKWGAVEKTEMYRIEIASDEGFKDMVFTTSIRENQLVVTKTLPKGRNYWRVRAEKGASKSDWSPVFTIEK
jgi:hypothetical protein